MKRIIVGISGRSGSGKSSIVNSILSHFGPKMVCLHTMDDYYKDRDQQIEDDAGYLNFDLPTSFKRKQFHSDLTKLIAGENVEIEEYVFNNESQPKIKQIKSTPIIIVEGLFILHYEEVSSLMDLKVLVNPGFKVCFNRRLHRDQVCRNYKIPEIEHRYTKHAEVAYQAYIKPYRKQVDLRVKNRKARHKATNKVINKICELL